MTLDTNVKAPDFELVSNKGDKIRLSEQWSQAPTVLAFFPLAFTGVCTEEMCDFRDSLADFADLNARVFAISVDSRFSLDVFAEKNGLEFPLLSDFNKEAATGFGVLYEDFLGLKGVAKRSVFVIDTEGVIRYRWVTDDARNKPNLDEVRDALKGL